MIETSITLPESEPSTFLAGLPADLQRELEELARDVEATGIEAMVRVGESLSRARERLARHPEGGFGDWCEVRLAMSARRARDLINIYETLGHDGAFALRGHSRRAVIDLASPSMPAEVRVQIVKAAARGKIHRAADIKVLKERFENSREWDERFKSLKPLRHLPGRDQIMVLHNGGFHSTEPIDVHNRTFCYIFQSEHEPERFELVCHDSRVQAPQTVAFKSFHRAEVDDIFAMADLCLGRLYERMLYFTKPMSADVREELQRICDLWNPPGAKKRRNCAGSDEGRERDS